MRYSQSSFVLHLFTYDTSLEMILREQYELSKRANISLSESDKMPEFERQAFRDMVINDLQREVELTKP